MKTYESIHLVKGEDLNHHGTLFAARAAAWFVESAFIAAASEYENPANIVCRNVHGMSFKKPIKNGDLIKFVSRVAYCGKTSMMVHVLVKHSIKEELLIDGFLTFVTIDSKNGKKINHDIVLDEFKDKEEAEIREQALKLRNSIN
ncbi:MAG: acyl-CoA thioesterase [Sarcina sp.]